MYDVRIIEEDNRMSKKVGSSSEFLRVARPKFTLNLQHLRVYEGKDVLGVSHKFEMLVLFNPRVSSLVPRTHLAHARRRGLVSQA